MTRARATMMVEKVKADMTTTRAAITAVESVILISNF